MAKPRDQLVIEPVKKEDGPAKKILKYWEVVAESQAVSLVWRSVKIRFFRFKKFIS